MIHWTLRKWNVNQNQARTTDFKFFAWSDKDLLSINRKLIVKGF